MSKESDQNIEIYHQALQLMEQNSQLRDAMYQSVADRVTLTTRFGLFMLIVIAISIYLLLNTLNSQVILMLDGIVTMNKSFSSVSSNMLLIQQDMYNINKKTQDMGHIRNSTQSVAKTLKGIHYSIADASVSMNKINTGMQYIDQSMYEVNQNIFPLSNNIFSISRDMYRISQPFESFNSLLP